ncbi:hypothetical protein KCP69_23955 [Salmonella enterica subsp. enterica]|nr:hypothetical protein KCP69_23955 [Salmonella enterica subsp. enterica]
MNFFMRPSTIFSAIFLSAYRTASRCQLRTVLFLYHVSRHVFGLTNSGACRNVHRQLFSNIYRQRLCAATRTPMRAPCWWEQERRLRGSDATNVDVLANFSRRRRAAAEHNAFRTSTSSDFASLTAASSTCQQMHGSQHL